MRRKYKNQRERRRARVRAKIRGLKTRPRLSVFRANKHIYAQLIDDTCGETKVSASDLEPTKNKEEKDKSKIEKARSVGELLAQAAKKKGIQEIVFDRSGYKYHGRVKALAEGAREGGLKF